jgi:mono/diheme cytochrome c family protein
MKAIIISIASLWVDSRLCHKVKLSIKQGTAVLVALGFSLSGVTGASSVSQKQWQAPATEAAKKNPVAPTQTSIAAGQKLYTKNCASCHGPSGDGDGRAAVELGIQPARLSESRSESDGALFWKITNGKKPMPGYGTRLSDTDRWSLISYIRTLSGK